MVKSNSSGKWLTDLPTTKLGLKEVVAVARGRWKIENETKNQGYHLEHNYGHGKKYLATNFALLTLLAFLVDQIAQHFDRYFVRIWDKLGSKKLTWQKIREVFNPFFCASMNAIYRFLSNELNSNIPLLELYILQTENRWEIRYRMSLFHYLIT